MKKIKIQPQNPTEREDKKNNKKREKNTYERQKKTTKIIKILF